MSSLLLASVRQTSLVKHIKQIFTPWQYSQPTARGPPFRNHLLQGRYVTLFLSGDPMFFRTVYNSRAAMVQADDFASLHWRVSEAHGLAGRHGVELVHCGEVLPPRGDFTDYNDWAEHEREQGQDHVYAIAEHDTVHVLCNDRGTDKGTGKGKGTDKGTGKGEGTSPTAVRCVEPPVSANTEAANNTDGANTEATNT